MNIESKYFDIVIATPGKSMVAEYTKSLINTINFFNDSNISYEYINEYSSHVASAREKTLRSFYEKHGDKTTYGKMIWIDSDISWSVKNIIDLYKTEKDIVSGAYILFEQYVAAHKNLNHIYKIKDINEMKNYEEILYCGMGFLSVSYGIFENIENPFYSIYHYDDQLIRDPGEDTSFCIKAKTSLNKKIWIDPKIKVNHHKISTLSWDE